MQALKDDLASILKKEVHTWETMNLDHPEALALANIRLQAMTEKYMRDNFQKAWEEEHGPLPEFKHFAEHVTFNKHAKVLTIPAKKHIKVRLDHFFPPARPKKYRKPQGTVYKEKTKTHDGYAYGKVKGRVAWRHYWK